MKSAPAAFAFWTRAVGKQRLSHLAARVGGVELVAGLRGDDARQVRAVHLANASGPLDEGFGIGFGGRDHAAHHAVGAQVADEGAGVDLGQNRDGVALHVLVGHLLGAPVGADGGELADDQAFDIGPGGLIVGAIGAVVADLGVGEDDDLAGIGGIGGDFLVTGERSIKNDFALAFSLCAMAVPAEDAPVFERQDRLHRLSEEWIQSILAHVLNPL